MTNVHDGTAAAWQTPNMLKVDVDYLSALGRRKRHTHLIVVFDTTTRREHHRFVGLGESVEETVVAIGRDPTNQIIQLVELGEGPNPQSLS
jgi:hypothetical protein